MANFGPLAAEIVSLVWGAGLLNYKYLTCLDRRRNFEEEIAISERPDSFDGTHCAANCLVENEWRKL